MMKRIVAGRALAVVFAAIVLTIAASATARPPAGLPPQAAQATANVPTWESLDVCPEEGKVDVEEVFGEELDAIEGLAPGEYCVKAGSARQGNGCGAVIVTVGEDGILRHPCGKDISHYSPLDVSEPPGDEDPPS